MKAFYCDHFTLPLPASHRFPMAKYRALRERLVDERVIDPADLLVPEPAPWATLELVHHAAYVRAVATGTLPAEAQRRIGFPWSPEMVERSRRSVGATIAASEVALGEGVAANLAGGTHHAFADRGEGYCVFNDVAVAARALLERRAVERVLVVDLDVHQGNGTAAIFAREPRVFTMSLHGACNFPFRKERSDLDVALPDGTTDDEYLAALEPALASALAAHRPDFAFYLAGADPYEGDRLGRLQLTIDGLMRRDRTVFDACTARRVPVALSMGGGYAPAIDDIVTIHANTVRLAAGTHHRWIDSRSSAHGRGLPAASSATTTDAR